MILNFTTVKLSNIWFRRTVPYRTVFLIVYKFVYKHSVYFLVADNYKFRLRYAETKSSKVSLYLKAYVKTVKTTNFYYRLQIKKIKKNRRVVEFIFSWFYFKYLTKILFVNSYNKQKANI